MILTVFERANLLNILPKEGNFKTLKTVRKLRESLVLTEDEAERWKPQFSDERMEWLIADDDGNPIPQEADIPITPQGIDVITEILKKLDDKKMLKEEHYSLYEKFMGDN